MQVDKTWDLNNAQCDSLKKNVSEICRYEPEGLVDVVKKRNSSILVVWCEEEGQLEQYWKTKWKEDKEGEDHWVIGLESLENGVKKEDLP